MDLTLSPEDQALVDVAAEWGARLLEGYARREEAGTIEPEVRRGLGEAGLILPSLPPEYGGAGRSNVAAGRALEQLSRGDINVGYLTVVGSLVGQIIVRNGSEELKRRWLPAMASGEDIVAIGLSEPAGGSDAGNPRVTARLDGDEWVIDGTKSMSFALTAGATVIFARTDEGKRGRGISAFLVELDRDGVRREPTPDMGTKCVERGFVTFEGVRVPAGNLLGERGAAFTQVMQGFDFSRALIGLQCLGAAQQSLEETYAHVAEREAFDQPIGRFQGVAFPLAEADTLVTAARALCERTLWLKDAGLEHTKEAAMCKWWAPKTAYDVVNQCLLTHGQFGYLTTRPYEQRLRDVLGLQIGDGTAQIMKLIIARHNQGRTAAP